MGPRSMLPTCALVLVLVIGSLVSSPATVALLTLAGAGGALAATWTLWRLLPPPAQRLVSAIVRERIHELGR